MKYLLLLGLLLVARLSAAQNAVLWKIEGNELTKPSYLYGYLPITTDEIAPLVPQKVVELSSEIEAVATMIDLGPRVQPEFILRLFNPSGDNRLRDILSVADYEAFNAMAEDIMQVSLDQLTDTEILLLGETLLAVRGAREEEAAGVDPAIPQAHLMSDYLATLYNQQGKQVMSLAPFTFITTDIDPTDTLLVRKAVKRYLEGISVNTSPKDALAVKAYNRQNIEAVAAYNSRQDKTFFDSEKLLELHGPYFAASLVSKMHYQPVLAVVDVGYLTGEPGLINQLKERGYTLSPVQTEMVGAEQLPQHLKGAFPFVHSVGNGKALNMPGAPVFEAVDSRFFYRHIDTDFIEYYHIPEYSRYDLKSNKRLLEELTETILSTENVYEASPLTKDFKSVVYKGRGVDEAYVHFRVEHNKKLKKFSIAAVKGTYKQVASEKAFRFLNSLRLTKGNEAEGETMLFSDLGFSMVKPEVITYGIHKSTTTDDSQAHETVLYSGDINFTIFDLPYDRIAPDPEKTVESYISNIVTNLKIKEKYYTIDNIVVDGVPGAKLTIDMPNTLPTSLYVVVRGNRVLIIEPRGTSYGYYNTENIEFLPFEPADFFPFEAGDFTTIFPDYQVDTLVQNFDFNHRVLGEHDELPFYTAKDPKSSKQYALLPIPISDFTEVVDFIDLATETAEIFNRKGSEVQLVSDSTIGQRRIARFYISSENPLAWSSEVQVTLVPGYVVAQSVHGPAEHKGNFEATRFFNSLEIANISGLDVVTASDKDFKKALFSRLNNTDSTTKAEAISELRQTEMKFLLPKDLLGILPATAEAAIADSTLLHAVLRQWVIQGWAVPKPQFQELYNAMPANDDNRWLILHAAAYEAHDVDLLMELIQSSPPKIVNSEDWWNAFRPFSYNEFAKTPALLPYFEELINFKGPDIQLVYLLGNALDAGVVTATDLLPYQNLIDARLDEITNRYRSTLAKPAKGIERNYLQQLARLLGALPTTPQRLNLLRQLEESEKEGFVKFSVAVALYRHNQPPTDVTIATLAKDELFLYDIVGLLQEYNQLERLPSSQAKQQEVAQSLLVNRLYKESLVADNIKLFRTEKVEVEGEMGYYYFFRIKFKGDAGTEYYLGGAGLFSEDQQDIVPQRVLTNVLPKQVYKGASLERQLDKMRQDLIEFTSEQ